MSLLRSFCFQIFGLILILGFGQRALAETDDMTVPFKFESAERCDQFKSSIAQDLRESGITMAGSDARVVFSACEKSGTKHNVNVTWKN